MPTMKHLEVFSFDSINSNIKVQRSIKGVEKRQQMTIEINCLLQIVLLLFLLKIVSNGQSIYMTAMATIETNFLRFIPLLVERRLFLSDWILIQLCLRLVCLHFFSQIYLLVLLERSCRNRFERLFVIHRSSVFFAYVQWDPKSTIFAFAFASQQYLPSLSLSPSLRKHQNNFADFEFFGLTSFPPPG